MYRIASHLLSLSVGAVLSFLLLADKLGGMKEFVEGNDNWYVYYQCKTWFTTSTAYAYRPEVVYMTEDCALEVCRILNEGEYEL